MLGVAASSRLVRTSRESALSTAAGAAPLGEAARLPIDPTPPVAQATSEDFEVAGGRHRLLFPDQLGSGDHPGSAWVLRRQGCAAPTVRWR